MNKKLLSIGLFSCLMTFSSISSAALDFISAKDFSDSNKLRGFNIGVVDTHNDNYYQELSATKINAVRVILPFRRCTAATEQATEKKTPEKLEDVKADAVSPVPKCIYEVSPDNISKFESILKQAVVHKFYVIPAAEFQQDPMGDFWTVPKLQQGMVDAWKDFATKYKDHSIIAAYEIMNNPPADGLPQGTNVSDYWSKGGDYIIQGIRSVDKKHAIIFPMAPSGLPTSFKNFKPLADKNIVYGLNMYYPLDITMQGVNPSFSYRIPYPAGLEYGIQPIPGQPPRAIDINDLRLYLQDAGVFAKANNVPIIVSEFGIVHYAPNGSAFRYVSDVTKVFEEYNWSWMYQGFRISAAFDPYIASDDPEDTTRSSISPIMNVLTSYFGKNTVKNIK